MRWLNRSYYALLLVLLGCGGSSGSSGSGNNGGNATPVAVVSLSLTPSAPLSLATSATQQLTASAKYSDGSTKDVTASASWSSSSITIASVSAGLVTAVGTGTAAISVSLSSQSASINVTVAPVLKSIAVAPAAPSIAVGATQQFDATANYSDGSSKDLSSTAAWTSSTTSVATVSATGLATALGVGSTSITATIAGISGSATLTVPKALASIVITPTSPTVSIGAGNQLTATGKYNDGTSLDITSLVAWSSSNAAVTTVSSTGFDVGVYSGTAQISATLNGTNGSVTITVSDKPPHFQVFSNPTDPHILEASTFDGYTVDYFGTKDGTGLATGITSILITHPDGKTTSFTVDSSGRPTETVGTSGGALTFNWQSATQGTVSVISPDGSYSTGPINITLPAAAAFSNALPAKVRTLQKRLMSQDASTVNNTCNLVVTRCGGRPVTSASNVSVYASITGLLRFTGSPGVLQQSPPGDYLFTIPVPSPSIAQTAQNLCNAASEVANTVCKPYEALGIAIPIITGILFTTGVGIPEAIVLTELTEVLDADALLFCAAVNAPPVAPPGVPGNLETLCKEDVIPVVDYAESRDIVISPVATLPGHGALPGKPQTAPGIGPFMNFPPIDFADTGDCGIKSVSIAPPTPSIKVGQTLPLTAVALDGEMATVPGATFTWSSDNPSAKVESSTGVVSGVSPGTATITATETTSQVSGATTVTVTTSSAGDRFVAVGVNDGQTLSMQINGVTIGSYTASNPTGTGAIFRICQVPDSTTLTIGLTSSLAAGYQVALGNFTASTAATLYTGGANPDPDVTVETDTCIATNSCQTLQQFQAFLISEGGTANVASANNSCVTIPAFISSGR